MVIKHYCHNKEIKFAEENDYLVETGSTKLFY